jgi:hypothetical protein
VALEAMVSQGRSSKRDSRKSNATVPCRMCSMGYTATLSSMLLLLPTLLLLLSFLACRVTAIPEPVSTLKIERIHKHLEKFNRPAVKSIQVITDCNIPVGILISWSKLRGKYNLFLFLFAFFFQISESRWRYN